MQAFAPLLFQHSALRSHFADEIPDPGVLVTRQRKSLTWWHGLLVFNYCGSIWEEARHKFNSFLNNAHSTVSRASRSSCQVWVLHLHYFPFIIQDCFCIGLCLECNTIIIRISKITLFTKSRYKFWILETRVSLNVFSDFGLGREVQLEMHKLGLRFYASIVRDH